MTKSTFDSGNWSSVNGLPGQNDIIQYLEYLLLLEPNKCHTRRGLMDSVVKEFGIPDTNAEAEGPQSMTAGFYTRMTYLITDAVQGKRRADGNQFAKRLSLGVYQHVTGNGIIDADLKKFKRNAPKISKKLVEEARVSVRILKSLAKPFDADGCMAELGGRCWSDEIIERAIELEFGEMKSS